MSVAELARRSDMDESQLGKVLRGKRALRADECERIRYALEIAVNALMPPDVARRLAALNHRTDGHVARGGGR